MRPTFHHENSYACLLAEVLEEEQEKSSSSSSSGSGSDYTNRRGIKKKRRASRISSTFSSSSVPSVPSSAPTPPSSSSSSSRLVELDDPSLPEVLKFNRFVQTGYRRAPLTKTQCLCSLRYAHNETFNVLSHLIPLVAIAVALATGTLSSVASWPASRGGGGGEGKDLSLPLHALPVVLCLAGSVAYHLLMADSPHYASYLRVDVCGILLLTVDGTRAMASRPSGCVAVGNDGGGEGVFFSLLALLREVLVSPWASSSSPSSLSLSSSLSSLSSLSSAALARDAALASYAALVVLAATKVLKGRTAAERGFPLLALLLARFAVLAARAAEVKSLTFASSSSSLSLSSPLFSSVCSLRASLRWYACAEAASFVGGLVNVLRVPERWVRPLPALRRMKEGDGDGGDGKEEKDEKEKTEPEPPRFRLVDFALNSHNLMHLFSLVALACYHAAAAEDRRHWLEHGCGGGDGG